MSYYYLSDFLRLVKNDEGSPWLIKIHEASVWYSIWILWKFIRTNKNQDWYDYVKTWWAFFMIHRKVELRCSQVQCFALWNAIQSSVLSSLGKREERHMGIHNFCSTKITHFRCCDGCHCNTGRDWNWYFTTKFLVKAVTSLTEKI